MKKVQKKQTVESAVTNPEKPRLEALEVLAAETLERAERMSEITSGLWADWEGLRSRIRVLRAEINNV